VTVVKNGLGEKGRRRLCDELDDTTSLLDLPLGVLGEVTGADDEGDFWDAALAEDLGVAEREEVEDWCGVLGLAGDVLLALLSRDEGPQLGFCVRWSHSDGAREWATYLPCRG